MLMSIYLFVADVVKSLDTVDGDLKLGCLAVLGCFLHWSSILILRITPVFGYGLNWLLDLVNLGHDMVRRVFHKDAR